MFTQMALLRPWRRVLAIALSTLACAAVTVTTGLVTSAPANSALAAPLECGEKYIFLFDKNAPVYNRETDSIPLCPNRVYSLGEEKPNLHDRVDSWRNYSDRTVCLWDKGNLWEEIDRLGPGQHHDDLPEKLRNRADAVGPC